MGQENNDGNSRQSFSALYVRDFRIFWIGNIISFSGTWMQSVAQGWLIYSLTKSPLYLGVVATAASLPVLIFTLLGGVVADRFAKRKLLIVTQSLSIIPAILLAVLTGLNITTVWEIIFIAFFLGTVNAFDVPARQSFLSEMVQRGRLLNAIALNSAAFNGGRVLGPVAAGIIIASAGIAACFYLNALTFLAVIFALLRIKAKGEHKGLPMTNGRYHLMAALSVLLRDLFEAFRFVKNEKGMFRVMGLVGVFSLFGIPFVTFLPVFAEDILRVGPKGLGFLAGATGIGALSASLIIAFRGDIIEKGRFMALAGLVFSLSLFALAVSRDYHFSIILLVFAGWGAVSFFAVANSFIQLSTPDNLRGRVMSVYTFFFLGFAPFGNLVLGSVADLAGTPSAVIAGSIICFITTVMLYKDLKTLRR
ncbi:MAG: MFS transporter [Nitrospirota bacterium]